MACLLITEMSNEFLSKGLQPLFWAVSRVAYVKITKSDISNRLNFCAILNLYIYMYSYKYFTNVAAGRITQPGGPRFVTPAYTVAGLSPRILVSSPRHVDKAALGIVSIRVLRYLSFSIMTATLLTHLFLYRQCYIIINLAIVGVVK
jgi:hypothetical protein